MFLSDEVETHGVAFAKQNMERERRDVKEI